MPNKKGRKTDKAIALEARVRELEVQVEAFMAERVGLTQKAYIDSLTGLYNRTYYEEFMSNLLSLADRENIAVSIILVDADKFKDVNDRFGHFVGDLVLKYLAGKVRRQTDRAIINTSEVSDATMRIGGEEFMIILPNTDLKGALIVAERIRQEVEASVDHKTGKNVLQVRGSEGRLVEVVLDRSITISLGVAQRNPGENLDSLYRRVDQALYGSEKGRQEPGGCRLELSG